MPLTQLLCGNMSVIDPSPIKGMPLQRLWLDAKASRDTGLFRSIKTLETINEKPAAEVWKKVEDQ